MQLFVLCADFAGFQKWAVRRFPNLRGQRLASNLVYPLFNRESCQVAASVERNQLVVELADFQRLSTEDRQFILNFCKFREMVPVIIP